ncbi:MAG: GNAT family N-acetyltransferase [Bacteroidota bacterium]
MIIRQATEEDINSIVNLLRLSLGDSLMPKSNGYWKWKHIYNPFGVSPVLVAIEDNMIVGVRAFMRWEWKKNDEIIKAVRAVDTATHPNYQGKGIFRSLTMEMIDLCEKEGVDMIYNTPNQHSLPGYLKMGWQEAGSLSVGISINKPFNIIGSLLFEKGRNQFLDNRTHTFNVPENISFFELNNWRTNYSYDYLIWRYKKIPNINYYSLRIDKTIAIFRLIKNKYGVELRVCDVVGDLTGLRHTLWSLKNSVGYDFISIEEQYVNMLPGWLKRSIHFGPNVTIKDLNRSTHDFYQYANWSPSIGDLEVF